MRRAFDRENFASVVAPALDSRMPWHNSDAARSCKLIAWLPESPVSSMASAWAGRSPSTSAAWRMPVGVLFARRASAALQVAKFAHCTDPDSSLDVMKQEYAWLQAPVEWQYSPSMNWRLGRSGVSSIGKEFISSTAARMVCCALGRSTMVRKTFACISRARKRRTSSRRLSQMAWCGSSISRDPLSSAGEYDTPSAASS
mmetsp:Transcript_37185/g.96491  ORF Transcript_37185/g.96491 Transcript_37185/m.96491 type:complete len:200 (+) Transcript_37185:380-979(+)